MTAAREVTQRIHVWMKGGQPQLAKCLGCQKTWKRNDYWDSPHETYEEFCIEHSPCTPDPTASNNGTRP